MIFPSLCVCAHTHVHAHVNTALRRYNTLWLIPHFSSWLQRRAGKSFIKLHKASLRSDKVGCSCLERDCAWFPVIPPHPPPACCVEHLIIATSFPLHRLLGHCTHVCLWPACQEWSPQQLPDSHCCFAHPHTYNLKHSRSKQSFVAA